MRQLLKYFINGEHSVDYSIWFTQNFEGKDFTGLDQISYYYLKFCVDLGVECNNIYIDAFLQTDAKSIIYSNNIKLPEMGNYNYDDPTALESGVRVVINALVALHQEASRQAASDDYHDEAFKADVKVWMNSQKKQLLQDTITKVVSQFNSGLTTQELMDDAQASMDLISSAYNEKKIETIDLMKSRDMANMSSPSIGGSGIPCIGDLFKGLLYTITAPSGAGKTRLITRILYNLMVYEGVSSLFYSLELPSWKIMNIFISIHVSVRFNITMPDKSMNDGILTNEQLKYYNAAKADLFDNPNSTYGKVIIIDAKTPIETFYKEVLSIIRRDPKIQILGIDYIGLFTSKPLDRRTPPIQRSFIPGEAYDVIHDILKDTNLACIALNQYTGGGATKAKNGEDIVEGDIAGGPSINRYTDFNIYINQTREQLAGGYLQMTADKVRMGKGFYRVLFRVIYPISKFIQQQSKDGGS